MKMTTSCVPCLKIGYVAVFARDYKNGESHNFDRLISSIEEITEDGQQLVRVGTSSAVIYGRSGTPARLEDIILDPDTGQGYERYPLVSGNHDVPCRLVAVTRRQ